MLGRVEGSSDRYFVNREIGCALRETPSSIPTYFAADDIMTNFMSLAASSSTAQFTQAVQEAVTFISSRKVLECRLDSTLYNFEGFLITHKLNVREWSKSANSQPQSSPKGRRTPNTYANSRSGLEEMLYKRMCSP